MSDDLRDIIAMARDAMPDVPAQVWERFESMIRANYGASRVYIAARKKSRHLAMLQANPEHDIEKVQQMLGVGRAQAYELLKLSK